MITLTYFEAVLLVIIMFLVLYFSYRSRSIVLVKDKNFYSELRREAVKSLTEDIRQQIYEDEYNQVKLDLEKDVKKDIKGNVNTKKTSTKNSVDCGKDSDYPDLTNSILEDLKNE